MSQDGLMKVLAGAGKIMRNSADILKNKSSQYIEHNIVKGKYVSREEFEQLHKLVLKMEQKLLKLENKDKK